MACVCVVLGVFGFGAMHDDDGAGPAVYSRNYCNVNDPGEAGIATCIRNTVHEQTHTHTHRETRFVDSRTHVARALETK